MPTYSQKFNRVKKILLYSILIANYCVLLSFWWHFSGPLLLSNSLSGSLLAFGHLVGLLATNLILLQLILIGRVKWVESVFGLDKLSRIHRRDGYIILGLIIIHPFLITLSYSILNHTTFLGQYADFLKNWDDILKAFLGYIILLLTVGLSIVIVRKRLRYETWYYVHIFNYAAIALILGHQLRYGPIAQSVWFRSYWYLIYAFTFGNLVWFRIFRPLYYLRRHNFRITRVVPEGVATSIYVTGQRMEKFKIKPGQFMIFRFWQKGFWWQAHPFSMSMVPKNNEIRLTAKKLGDFTNEMPNLKPDSIVLIDGPHGVFTADIISKDKLLFIAGGIGITPIRSLLESLGPIGKDIILLYSNKSRSEIVLDKELAELSQQYGFKIVNILGDENVEGYENGRLDKDMLKRLVPDIAKREVFVCGPPPMMSALQTSIEQLGVSKDYIHSERFAL